MTAELQSWTDHALGLGFAPHQVFQAQALFDEFSDHDEELLFWFLLFEACHRDQGHLRLPLDPEGFTLSIEAWDRGWTEDQEERLFLQAIADSLIREKDKLIMNHPRLFDREDSPYLMEGQNCYTRRQWAREQHLLQSLTSRFEEASRGEYSSALGGWDSTLAGQTGEGLIEEGMEITPDALSALERLYRFPLSVLSGGPGTGKTTTLVFILSLLLKMAESREKDAPRIMLAAPTGRAAKRMEEALRQRCSLNLPASTLHKLIGLGSPRGPRWNRERPLPADLVVVDEASMMDITLMSRLLDALTPNTPLLLIGDRDQLPSVDSGALLGDLLLHCGRQGHPLNGAVTFLEKVYRSGTDILELARKIRQGEKGLSDDLQMKPDLCFVAPGNQEGVLLHQFPRDFSRWMDQLARLYPLPRDRGFSCRAEQWEEVRHSIENWFRIFDDIAVLCPLRRGPYGVEQLNRQLLSRLYPHQLGEIHHGQSIMVTRNDYELNLFNGDRGIVFLFQDLFYVLFPHGDGWRPVPLAYLKNWESCYVQTVHKSQGSEYNRVLILLPPGGESLLYRELLYTAVTRGRTQVILTADKGSLKTCLERGVYRSSGLSDLGG